MLFISNLLLLELNVFIILPLISKISKLKGPLVFFISTLVLFLKGLGNMKICPLLFSILFIEDAID